MNQAVTTLQIYSPAISIIQIGFHSDLKVSSSTEQPLIWNPKQELMKTTLLSKKTAAKVFLINLLFAATFFANAQSGQSIPELVFKNPSIESGSAGSDGTVYRFKQVATDIDVLLKIEGRSSSKVKISSIDLSNTGYDNAFQPRISYNNGTAPKNTNWWVDFSMNFVRKGTSTPITVNSFKVTALDVDGDDSKLAESVSFYGAQSYIVEQNSSLSIKTLLDLLLGILTPGVEFKGTTKEYPNVSTSATNIMATLTYSSKSSFKFRTGASVGSSSSADTDRMYSFWFKGFNYNVPSDISLPVKMVSFSAMLNNDAAVDLKWVTASEKNVSHFSIEKSTDGKNYSAIGLVFANGNTSETINYSFTDKDINTNNAGVIYYRIRSVDIDGANDLSIIRSIRIAKKDEQRISILAYPNPVTSELRITIPSNWQGKKISYELLNNNGQAVIKNIVGAGSQTETMNVNNAAPGFYIVKVTCNGEVAQQKIIKK